jgi:hypothetical protein
VRVIIAGSRDIYERDVLDRVMDECPWTPQITEVVCGGATGIDALGDGWAFRRRLPVRYYIVTREGRYDYSRLYNRTTNPSNVTVAADWEWNGNEAGPIRNTMMARYADALIVVPLRGRRKGSDSMIREARTLGLPIFEREHVR